MVPRCSVNLPFADDERNLYLNQESDGNGIYREGW